MLPYSSTWPESETLAFVRVAIIGGGPESAVGLAHLSALSMDSRFEVVAGFFGTSEAESLRWQQHMGGVWVAPSVSALLESERARFELVLILTPPGVQSAIALEVLKSGRDVLMEKPGGLSSEELFRVSAMATETSRRAFVMHNYQTFPMFAAIRELVGAGKIGRVHTIRGTMLQQGFVRRIGGELNPIQTWRKSDYGVPTVALDLGVHLLQLSRSVLGFFPERIWSAEETRSSWGVVDSVEWIGRGPGNTVFQLGFGKSYLGSVNELEVSFFGTKGSLRWGLKEPEILKQSDDSGRQVIHSREPIERVYPGLASLARFKDGHPVGFVESLANYYSILADVLEGNDARSEWLVTAALAGECLSRIESRALLLGPK